MKWYDELIVCSLVISYLCVDALIAVFSVLAIEMIIRWNHISNAYSLGSIGQIIPLVIGFGNLWKVIVSLLNEVSDESAVSALFFASMWMSAKSYISSGIPITMRSDCETVDGELFLSLSPNDACHGLDRG